MPVFIIILNYHSDRLDSHLVETHLVLSILSMAEALPKNVESLESPVKCLLTIFSTGQKFLELARVLVFRHVGR